MGRKNAVLPHIGSDDENLIRSYLAYNEFAIFSKKIYPKKQRK